MASLFGTDNSADFATQRVGDTLGLGGGPRIYMVRDIAPAQRALAGFLRPPRRTSRRAHRSGRGWLAARALAVGQIWLAETFASWAEGTALMGTVAAEAFRSRIPVCQAQHRSTLRLTEVKRRRSLLILAQQSELVMQFRAFRCGGISLAGLVDLNQATHELATAAGKALRAEGMHRKDIPTLVSRDIGLPEPQPITNAGHRFNLACKRLADESAPTAVAAAAAPVKREKLRLALAATPGGPARWGPPIPGCRALRGQRRPPQCPRAHGRYPGA